MTTFWQNTLTWKNGLVYELPVGMLQTISGNDSIEMFLCEKLNVNQTLSPGNIRRLQTISSGEMGRISFWDSLIKSGQHVCIVVDMRLRTHKVDCKFITKDLVNGSMTIHLQYRVSNSKKVVFDVEDVLSDLSTICQKVVVNIARKNKYSEIDQSLFEEAVKDSDTHKLGIELIDVHIPDQINWPNELMSIKSRPPILQADAELKSFERKLLVEKLESIGLPENVIKIVLVKKEEELKVIFDAAEALARSKKESKEDARAMLEMLIDKGLVPRITLEETLLPKVIDQVTNNDWEDGDPLRYLLSSSDGGGNKPKALSQADSENSNTLTDNSSTEAHSVNRAKPDTTISEKQASHSYTRRPANLKNTTKED